VPAQGWSHTRRQCVDAERAEPRLGAAALDRSATCDKEEADSREHGLAAEAKLAHRGEDTNPRVEDCFAWLNQTVITEVRLPADPFAQAVRYPLERETALTGFRAAPEVPLETNQLEREIRPLAVGRRHGWFCGTEVGARQVGISPSVLASCRLPGVDPYGYLVDVRHRVDTHPAFEVQLLTPRLWQQHFADTPLRSDLDRCR
jgi:transposase